MPLGDAYGADVRNHFLSILILAGLSACGWSLDVTFEHMDYRKNGNYIVLPSHDRVFTGYFLFDTGCSMLALDEHYVASIGPVMGTHTMHTSGGTVEKHWFMSPAIDFGTWALPPGQTTSCISLMLMSQVAGIDLEGIVGLQDLQSVAMIVDYDRDLLNLSDVAPDPSALAGWIAVNMVFKEIPKVFDSGNWTMPNIKIEIAGEEMTLGIDTGDSGSLSLESGTFDRLVKSGSIKPAMASFSATASGQVTEEQGVIAGIKLGTVSYSAICVDRTALIDGEEQGQIGVGFLARHNLIFDFPRRRLYLQPRPAMMEKPDVPNQSGVHILLIDGKITVHSVDAGSPAERAGMYAGDQVRVIDGHDAVSIGPFECREFFAESGKRPLSLVIVRDGMNQTITLSPEH